MRRLEFDAKGASAEKTCYIFGAGSFYGLWSRPKEGDLVIAADGGLKYLQTLGIHPDVVLGDFDSEDESEARRAAGLALQDSVPSSSSAASTASAPSSSSEGGAEFVRLSVIKDRSDSAAALLLGRERGFTRFYLYGCTGMRLDHTLATLQDLAALAKDGLSGYLFDDGAVLTAIEGASLQFPNGMQGTISVFSHSDTAGGIWESGLQYTVAEHKLTNRFPLGLSNAFTKLPASVSVAEGCLIIYVKPQA